MGACVVTPDTADGVVAGDASKGWGLNGTIHLSASYNSGTGDTITAAQFGVGALTDLSIDAGGGYVFAPDIANLVVKAYFTGAGLSAVLAEVGITDLSGTVVRYRGSGY